MKRLQKEIDAKPKEAQLDINVDGESIGHMVLKTGGEYDLNLKSSDLPKTTEKKILVDDGAKIVEKKSAEEDTSDSIAKNIADSLK